MRQCRIYRGVVDDAMHRGLKTEYAFRASVAGVQIFRLCKVIGCVEDTEQWPRKIVFEKLIAPVY